MKMAAVQAAIFPQAQGKQLQLSIVPFGSDLWQDNLLVRDYLRAHPDEARLYAPIKRQGMKASPHSLLGYQNHKRAHMEALKGRARTLLVAEG